METWKNDGSEAVEGPVSVERVPTCSWLTWGLSVFFFFFFFLSVTQAHAVGEMRWVKRYGNLYAGPDYAKGMVVDKNNNIIVAGLSLGSATTYYDYALVKYNSAGTLLWTRRYSGPTGYDEPFGVAVDGQGNILVTGKSFGTRGVGLPDILTVKYDPNGTFKWARRYYGGDAATAAHEEGRAVAADAAGNVYVAGIASSKSNSYHDAVLIKYSSSGLQQWVRTYDGLAHDNDAYYAVAVDGGGNVLATGYCLQSYGNYQDFLTLKYNTAGTRLWLRTYNGTDSIEDWAESIAVDKQGNAIVTGSTGQACNTAEEVCYNYATIKYSATGVRSWVAKYNPLPLSDNMAHAVKIDYAGNVYVTGQSAWSSAFYDFATIKYSPAGKQLWARRYDGVGHGNDMAYALAVDSKGTVVVAGESYVSQNAESDFTVVKYDPIGASRWTRRYNGPGSDIDKAYFVAVDSADNVYASGFSVGGPTTAEDFVTIKYAP